MNRFETTMIDSLVMTVIQLDVLMVPFLVVVDDQVDLHTSRLLLDLHLHRMVFPSSGIGSAPNSFVDINQQALRQWSFERSIHTRQRTAKQTSNRNQIFVTQTQ